MQGSAASRSGTTTGLLIAGAVSVLALPSAVLGFGTKFQTLDDPVDAPGQLPPFRTDGSGARLARGLSLSFLGRGPLYPFTPAKNPNRLDRLVTVAVRLDSQALKTITVQGAKISDPAGTDTPIRIAPTGFNLGVARGYRNFAQEPAAAPVPGPTAGHRGDIPDSQQYSLAAGSHDDSRYNARLAADDRHGPRAFNNDDQVKLGGSYRVTRNFDVTAGVRYSQDRERLKPLTDGNQDSQAVYVGTQFKF